MLQAKELSSNHRDNSTIASALKIAPFLVSKYVGWARNFSFEELKAALELCVSNDEAVKTGKLDYVISVEMVIVKCASLKKAG